MSKLSIQFENSKVHFNIPDPSYDISFILENSIFRATTTTPTIVNPKKDIYHEFLHHYASLSDMYRHSKRAIDADAGDDLVYAFSNKAFSPDERFRGTEMPIIPMIYDAAEQIEPDARSGYMYSLSPTAPKFLNRYSLSLEKRIQTLGWGMIRHNFTFQQCITSGLARIIEKDRLSVVGTYGRPKLKTKAIVIDNTPERTQALEAKCKKESIFTTDLASILSGISH